MSLTRVKATPSGAPFFTTTFSHFFPLSFSSLLFSSLLVQTVFFPSSSFNSPITLPAMDANLRRDLLPPFSSSDPDPLPRVCGAQLTRTITSDSSSAITVDNTASKDSSHHCCAVTDAAPFPDKLTRWTDLKHSQYLNSLEASFVTELHRSMQLRASSLQNNIDEACKPRTLKNPHNMPRQSLALHDGCRKKISLERISPMLESTADSRVLAGSQFGHTSVERSSSLREPNTYDQGLLCDEGVHARRSSTFSNRTQKSLKKQCISCSSHPELIASTTEVTDQNFKEEVDRSSCMPVAKRSKTVAAEASSNDQVVPLGKFHPTDASTSSNSTSENKELELLSELPESFPFRKSDLHYFLRGS